MKTVPIARAHNRLSERLSGSLRESGLTARELYQASRDELEDRS